MKKLLLILAFLIPSITFAAQGDIYYGSTTYPFTKALPIGASSTCLTTNGTVPAWGSSCGSGGTNFFTNSGASTSLTTGSNLLAGLITGGSFISTSSATSTFKGGININNSNAYIDSSGNLTASGTASFLGGNVTFQNSFGNTNFNFTPVNPNQSSEISLNTNGSGIQWVLSSNGNNNTSGAGVYQLIDVPNSTAPFMVNSNDLTLIGGTNNTSFANQLLDTTSVLQVLGNVRNQGKVLTAGIGIATNTPAATFSEMTNNSSIPLIIASSSQKDMLVLLQSRNFGIATNTPAATLTIVGSEQLTGAFKDSTAATGTLGLLLQSTGTSTLWVSTSSLGISGSNFFTNVSASTSLTTGSNLLAGIGTFGQIISTSTATSTIAGPLTTASTTVNGPLQVNGSAPSQLFVGTSSISTNTNVFIQGNGTTSPFNISSSTGTNEFTVSNSGDVTILPNDSGNSSSFIICNPFNGYIGISIAGTTCTNSNYIMEGGDGNSYLNAPSGGHIFMRVGNDTTQPLIFSAGNFELDSNSFAVEKFSGTSGGVVQNEIGDLLLQNQAATGGIQFLTNNIERGYWTSSNLFGVGTTTPDNTLDVYGGFRLESASSTVITPSISGAIVGLGCDTATSSVDSSISSSTTAFVTTPQNYPGNGLTWQTYLSAVGVITTAVCSDVTVTPSASKYVVKIIR